jgi:hypothetical protein
MNTRILPVSAWLVAIGAGAVLIIGAFAHFDPASSPHAIANPSPNPPPLTQDDPPAEGVGAPALPANLSPGLSELIKLVQAHVDEGVILAYIQNSGQVFSPTADEILYLSDLGLSQDVIGALVKTAPLATAAQSPKAIAAAPVPQPAGPPAAPSPSDAGSGPNVFYSGLAPYGAWVQQPDYGLCWQPTVETINANWCPYVDAGQWLYSDSGWYWQSDYTWGWSVFHYGRWANVPHLGWVWVPGNQWAPAWVTWRSTPQYIGWAPLPPGMGLNVLGQMTYNSKPAGPNETFGLLPSAYRFVSTGNLISRHLPHHVVPASQAKFLVENSDLINSYAIVNNRIFNVGVNRDDVATAAHRAVPDVTLRAVSSPEAAGLARDNRTLAVYVAPASPAGASSSAQSDLNKSRAQAQEEKTPGQDPVMLAENDSADAAIPPSASDSGDLSVQLPPLRYPAGNPPGVRNHSRDVIVASGADATPAHRNWPRGYGTTEVARPATSAPRLEGYNAPARQADLPRAAVESRPAPVEPVHAAPALVAAAAPPSSSGSSRSGK